MSPFGDPNPWGGLWAQAPTVPIWRTVALAAGFSTRTLQFPGSATVMSPLRSR